MITAKDAKERAKNARERYIKDRIAESIDDGYDSMIFESVRMFDDIENLKPELEKLGYKVIRRNEKGNFGREYETIEVSWE
jgi:hypothetical protein